MSDQERADLLESLRHHRHLLRHTAFGLRDDQARLRSTVSQLTVGGLIKHVTRMEMRWANFMEQGTSAFGAFDDAAYAAHALPVTPWWPEGTRWSVRRAALHVVAETAQHAGHTDLIREAIDGQKSMG